MSSRLAWHSRKLRYWSFCWKTVLAVLLWHRAASAFEVVVSGAFVRAANQVRNEIFVQLSFPLDEWLTLPRGLTQLSHQQTAIREAWQGAETQLEQDAQALQDAQGELDALGLQDVLSQKNPLGEQAVQSELESQGLQDAPAWQPLTLGPTLTQSADERPMKPSEDRPTRSASPPRSIQAPFMPRVDALFLRGLMAACSDEFRVSRVQLADLASRARSSAWLPELQVKGGRNTDETLRLTPTEAEPDRYQLVGGDGVRFEGQIKWSFNQLVFARDELAVARLQGALDTEKRRRQHHAMDVLSKWLRAWPVFGDTNQEPKERIDAWLDERAARAELDWLSQGWFSRHVQPAPELTALVALESS